MKTLTIGKKAPSFALTDKDGNVFRLSDVKSDFAVVYFYPKDSTPGCTIEAKEFTSDLKKFSKIGAEVIGISGGNDKTKAKFCKSEKLTLRLLSDTDFAVSKKFGVFGEKTFMGRKFLGIHRKTFLLDKSGMVLKVYDKVSPEGHSEEVLGDIRAIKLIPVASKSRSKANPKLSPKRAKLRSTTKKRRNA